MKKTKGLLRQYWTKGTDFKTVMTNELDPIIVQLNNRPRKILGYNTPAQLMAEHIVAIAIQVVMHFGIESTRDW